MPKSCSRDRLRLIKKIDASGKACERANCGFDLGGEMATFFDIITVTCFLGLVIAFFQFTDREAKTLIHFILAGVVFAVANQVGNAGSIILALILILAGAGYATLNVRR